MTPDKIYMEVADTTQYHTDEDDFLSAEEPDDESELLEYTLTRRGTIEMVRSINWEVV